MFNATITTLTPVHVGSGRNLSANTEFIHFPKEDRIAVIDDRKILKILGEENVSQWVSTIDKNESLLKLLQRYTQDELMSDQIASRILLYEGDIFKSALNEQVHTGLNQPYLPGSSIKGAIRTAVFATKALEKPREAARSIISKDRRTNRSEVAYKLNDNSLGKSIFGNSANDDLFRFLRIGDAHFGEYYTIAVTGKIVNLEGNRYRFKRGQEQLLECIPSGATTQLSFKIGAKQLEMTKNTPNAGVLSEKGRLLKIINKHNLKLIENEISFWEDEEVEYPGIIDDYLHRLQEIKTKYETLKGNEAIFRMGFGSGWNFMTGMWAKDKNVIENEKLYDDFLNKLRSKKYDNAPFPKTRKIISTQDGLLGFVKLTIT